MWRRRVLTPDVSAGRVARRRRRSRLGARERRACRGSRARGKSARERCGPCREPAVFAFSRCDVRLRLVRQRHAISLRRRIRHAIAEFKRVLKPGGTLAIKDLDDTLTQFFPMDPGLMARFGLARRAESARAGALGLSCGPTLPSRLRRNGLTDIRRKSWLVERWAPVGPAARTFVEAVFPHWVTLAAQFDMSHEDLQGLQEAASNPSILLDDLDFCYREGFVVAVGRVAIG